MTARLLSGFVGCVMLFQAIGWLLDPSSAAASLGMVKSLSIETALGRNSFIGDFTSFFFTVGLLSCIGAYKAKYEWLYGPFSLLLFAALFRIYAGLFHGTEFLISAIIAEIIMASMLLISIYMLKKQ
ncbi:hypothetical protein OAP06_02400 [Gammaproteobacteria bacterium]|nr:hypothetical protein [Gammaproteobacteria bacterium]